MGDPQHVEGRWAAALRCETGGSAFVCNQRLPSLGGKVNFKKCHILPRGREMRRVCGAAGSGTTCWKEMGPNQNNFPSLGNKLKDEGMCTGLQQDAVAPERWN